jgi:hypothetical protein
VGIRCSTRHFETRSKRQRGVDFNFETYEFATNKFGRVVVQFQNFTNTFSYFDSILGGHELEWKVVDLNLESIEIQFYFINYQNRRPWLKE